VSTIVRSRAFFADERMQRVLFAEAQSWIGTPFHWHARLKMVGVDCVNLAAQIYKATGFLSEAECEFGWYPKDGASHDSSSRVLDWIERSGRFSIASGVNGVEAMPGDLLIFKYGCGKDYHVGVKLDGRQFIHTLVDHMVCVPFIDEPRYVKRLTRIYRPSVGVGEPALQHLHD
jgi:cell wall-associated NlpC family hydrolase